MEFIDNKAARHGLSRWIVILMVAGLSACGGSNDETGDTAPLQNAAPNAENATPVVVSADLVLRGGKIVTVDDNLADAEAIAINGYLITAIGSNEQIAAYIGADTQVIELNGRLVTPGFIEGHGHYMSLGRARQILDLSTAKNWQDIVNKVATAVDKAEPGEWIFGRGWHQEKWDSLPAKQIDGVPLNDSRFIWDTPVAMRPSLIMPR